MKHPTRQSLLQYVTLGLINSAVVYVVYTPYIFLWLHFSIQQYIRWLEGGVIFSLLTGWFYAFVMIRARKFLLKKGVFKA